LGQEDEKILALTAAMGSGTGINNFAKNYSLLIFNN